MEHLKGNWSKISVCPVQEFWLESYSGCVRMGTERVEMSQD